MFARDRFIDWLQTAGRRRGSGWSTEGVVRGAVDSGEQLAQPAALIALRIASLKRSQNGRRGTFKRPERNAWSLMKLPGGAGR